MAIKLKICTFNLRNSYVDDGINSFCYRKGRIVEAIRSENPDIIGFQEMTRHQRETLEEALFPLGYNIVGCGRDEVWRDEQSAIAYKRKDMTLKSLDTRWLSETPDVAGSRFDGDQSSCPRIMTALVLKHTASAPFLVINTHLDHVGNNARVRGAAQIVAYAKEKKMPLIVTGDMNARPESDVVKHFLSAAPRGITLVDATADIPWTFHNFGRYDEARRSKIDYIFTDLPTDPTESYILADEGDENGVYITDHYVVFSYITVE